MNTEYNVPIELRMKDMQENEYFTTFNLKFFIEDCGVFYSLQESTDIGLTTFVCAFDQAEFSPITIIIVISLIASIGIIVIGILYLIRNTCKKVVTLKKKEKAELELKQKLLDLETLYTNELEAKHSFKDWIIKVEDVELLYKVGEGGNGVVYKARWKNIDVALKTIKLDDADLDTNDFEHESTLLSSIRHPNIVTFYGVCLSDRSKYMVTEFMHGGSLEQLLYDCKTKKKQLNFTEKLSILLDICYGMGYLHHDRHNILIIHRDLKPGNILLSNDLKAKVTDFGLSKLFRSQDQAEMTKTCQVGSLLYMSSELLKGETYDESCDVYAYSIILWQVLFEESSLFHSSYTTNPKYSTIMSSEMMRIYSSVNDSFYLLPKLICEGLRLPIPSLPINYWNLQNWLSEYIFDASVPNHLHSEIAEKLFTLISKCWSEDIKERFSFKKIQHELNLVQSLLRTGKIKSTF